MPTARDRWRAELAAWAIPEHILAAVHESPWEVPAGSFMRRTDQAVAAPSGASYARAADALDPPGTVLDVGAGAGAASLPLAPLATGLVAVDTNAGPLDALTARAEALGLPTRTVVGRWPDVADAVSTVDVVVCHHVAYNVPDLAELALALDAHARRRVVMELTERHPLAVLNPLWTRLHGLARPTGPTAADAVAVLREVGLAPHVLRWQRPPTNGYDSFAELVDVTRRRLCLPPERADDVAQALRAHGVDPQHPDLGAGRDLVTLWWDRYRRRPTPA